MAFDFLKQDPTYIGGSQDAQGAVMGQYSAQQDAYEKARQQGAAMTQQSDVGGMQNGLSSDMWRMYQAGQQGQYKGEAQSGNMLGIAQDALNAPSAAQAQAQATYQQAAQSNLAQAGAANNSALATRNALMANGQMAQGIAGQAAAARAAEMSQRQANLLNAAGQQSQLNLGALQGANQNMAGQQGLYQQGQGNLANLGLQQQQLYLGGYQGQQTLGQNVQLTQAQMDQQRQAANQAAVMGFTGQVIGAGAGAASMGMG